MNHQPPVLAAMLLVFATAGAQIASHAPTVFRQSSANTPAVSATSPLSKPVVRINGSVLTESDLLREEYAIFPYARQHGGIPRDLAPQIRDGAMKMMVFEELVYQEALRRRMTVPAARLQRAENDFRKQFPNPEEYNAFVRSEFHGAQALLNEKIRRSLLIEALLKTEVENKSIVTPSEARAYYDRNPARFMHPETYTFQTISILPPPNATPAQLKEGRTRAEGAMRQAGTAKTSEQFGLLAEKISDDDYRVMMGQHKPVPIDQLAPQVVTALKGMKPGETSGLIQLEEAYTIVHLQVHTPAGKSKFQEVSAELEKELHQRKQNELRSALDQRLQKAAKIEVM